MKRKKRPLTLLEIMIVILIIGIIGSVIGFNMKGSLEKAKVFKSKEGLKKVEDILNLQLATGTPMSQILENPAAALDASGLVSNPQELLKDGWGIYYKIAEGKGGVKVSSERLEKQLAKEKQKNKDAAEEPGEEDV